MKSAALWAVAGALSTFAVVAGFSIGFLFVVPAVVALAVAARHPAGWPAVGVGAGAILLLVAWLNRGSGGLDARPWLVVGLTVSLGGAVATLLRLRAPPA